jgi:hypothetical protein
MEVDYRIPEQLLLWWLLFRKVYAAIQVHLFYQEESGSLRQI